MKIEVEIGVGDFIDRYIINEIKHEKGLSVDLKIYNQLFDKNNLQKDKIFKELKSVNSKLWDLENEQRYLRKNNQDLYSIGLRIFELNEFRYYLKKKIDLKHESDFTEIKSYDLNDQ
jgi:hypothetical protein